MSSIYPADRANDNAKDFLKKNAHAILFIELAALLHDIGKLSKGFLRYRQEWQRKKKEPDPHADKFLEKHETFKTLIPKEFKDITLGKYSTTFDEEDFSIKKAVDEHVNKESNGAVMKVLKAADRNDSAIDRNNPLYSAEQKTGQIFRSNVFGNECGSPDRIIDLEKQDEYRKKLYQELARLLPDYLREGNPGKHHFSSSQRRDIFTSVRYAFIHGLSDTCRPQNDTTLWDHSYAVASIAKVLTVHNLFCTKIEDIIDKFQDVKYDILGVGWDGLEFLSYGQKIGDVTARKRIIEEIKDHIREIVEHQYPVGNTVYEDDNGIYFIMPANFTLIKEGADGEGINQYGELPGILKKEIVRTVLEVSDCEIQPRFAHKSGCTQLTYIVEVISSINKKIPFRFSSDTEFLEQLKGTIKFHKGEEVCSICRLRPADREKSQGEKKICDICYQRRRKEAKTNRNKVRSKETIFVDEIVDQNQRAALIVARFDLDRWLDGMMLHTLFVTEARGIENEIKTLNEIQEFKGKEEEARKKLQDVVYDYRRITEDIDAILNKEEKAEYVSFLYTHGRAFPKDEDERKEKAEELEKLIDCRCESVKDQKICKYNVINAKSPTPSTILDVWQTTQNFFKTSVIKDIQEKSGMILRNRVTLAARTSVGGTFEAELVCNAQTEKIEVLLTSESNKADLIVSSDKLESIDNILQKPSEAIIRIIDKGWDNPDQNELKIKEKDTTPYSRYRVITASPYLFMAIVPADQAVKVSRDIYQQYQEQFGKVTGRLPFSIGNIFFRRQMPMFVILDSARRMLNNFERFSADDAKLDVTGKEKTAIQDGRFDIRVIPDGNQGKEFCYHIPTRLGNCETDYYHAYALLCPGNKASGRKGFFKTIVGDVVPYSELEEGDKLCLYPNYYDFLYLDSNQKRHEIFRSADETDCYFLEELEQKFVRLWDNLIAGDGLPGITQTKLKNLEALWLSKYQSWGGSHPMFEKLVKTSLNKEFVGMTDENKELMMETLKNGLFFRMMELQHTILKKRVRDDKETNNDKTV